MTDKELEQLKHYARKVYYSDPDYYYGMTFEDVYHEYVLIAMSGKKHYSVGFQVRAKFGKFAEQIPVDRATPFSVFVTTDKDGRDDNTALDRELAFSVEDSYFDQDNSGRVVSAIADMLYPKNEDMRKCFKDFAYGCSGIGARAAKFRSKLFNHAVEVLNVFLDFECITFEAYKKYSLLLQTMTRYGSNKRPLKYSADTVRCRAYYEVHKDELRAKKREYARKRRAMQAEQKAYVD